MRFSSVAAEASKNSDPSLGCRPSFVYGALILAGLYLLSRFHFLMFHTTAELFSIIVACSIFLFTWTSWRYFDNHYLPFIGVAYLFLGIIDLLHTLAYKGMNLFPETGSNLATQLWIASRYLGGVALLFAPLFIQRRLNKYFTLIALGAVTTLVLATIFTWKIFPVCMAPVEVAGQWVERMTPFKLTSEYLIAGLMLGAIGLLRCNRRHFDPAVIRLLTWSLSLGIAAELVFTTYRDVYDLRNLTGHYLKIVSYFLIYRVILETGLTRPHELLYRNLKQSEEALRESEQRYRSLVEAMPTGLALHRDGRYIYVNPAAARLFGAADPAELLGQAVMDRVPPSQLEFVTQRIRLVNAGQTTPLRETQILRLDGQVVDVDTMALPIHIESGPASLVLLRDITDRKRAEAERERLAAAIAEQQELLQAVFDTAPIAIALIDLPDFRYRLANPTYRQIPGLPDEELVGRKVGEALPHLAANGLFSFLDEVVRTRRPVALREFTIRLTADSDPSWWNIDCVPFLDERGAVDQILLLASNVTEHVQARQQLEALAAQLAQMNHSKDNFISMLGHELRNPLAPIQSSIQVLRARGNNNEHAHRFLGIIERQSQHMARLVDDLLDVSRITRGKITLKKQRVDLVAHVRHALESCQAQIEQRRHELHAELPDAPVWLEADPTRLEQIMINLVTNAAKYTEPGGRIRVTVEPGADAVRVAVRDNGLGIPPEMLAQIFEPFSQVERSLDRAQGGLGLGLTLVRRLAELHGGHVEARSPGIGQGSEFILTLPALAPLAPAPVATVPLPPAPPPTSAVPTEGRLRVLIVEDNQDTAQSMGELLELWDHEPRLAYTGAMALERARQCPPDVVLLDIGLPDMDGYQVARALRRERSGASALLVALTVYGQEDDQQRALVAGFDRHFTKPIDIPQLRQLLAEQIQARHGAPLPD